MFVEYRWPDRLRGSARAKAYKRTATAVLSRLEKLGLAYRTEFNGVRFVATPRGNELNKYTKENLNAS